MTADLARMVEEIQSDTADTAPYSGRATLGDHVTGAMRRVARHLFVPEALSSLAYLNRPLPIGHGQTISQPFIVALMSDLLNINAGDKVLEIGTGTGYQTAVLAEMGAQVYSVEIIAPLAIQAAERLKSAGYRQIATRAGDGYEGWPEAAPFDAIIVTAAADHIPPPLITQLKPGGRLVIPLGGQFAAQSLMLIEKKADGSISTRDVLPVRFVPLTRTASS